MRTFFALVATAGLIASGVCYLASFFGLSVGPSSNAQPWCFLLVAGGFLTGVAMTLTEFDGELSDRTLFFKRFSVGRPAWALSMVRLLFLVFVVHFVGFMFLTKLGSPDMVEGQFVLKGHREKKVLSRAEYELLTGGETRMAASFGICLYLYTALYWWGPRIKTTPGPYDV